MTTYTATKHRRLSLQELADLSKVLEPAPLFADTATAPHPPAAARITCCVCRMPATVARDWLSLLCPVCAGSPATTLAHIEAVLALAYTALERAGAVLDAAVTKSDADTQQRWDRLLAARAPSSGMSDATLEAKIAKTAATYPAIAALLDLEAQMTTAIEVWQERAEWAARGRAEMETHKQTTESSRHVPSNTTA